MGSIEPEVRVCPRCGSPAGEQRFCGECGLNLASLPEIPTRQEWDRKSAPKASAEASDPGLCHACGKVPDPPVLVRNSAGEEIACCPDCGKKLGVPLPPPPLAVAPPDPLDRCPSCGKEYTSPAVVKNAAGEMLDFCPNCGTSLAVDPAPEKEPKPDPDLCPACGKRATPRQVITTASGELAEFCPHCGKRLARDPRPPGAPVHLVSAIRRSDTGHRDQHGPSSTRHLLIAGLVAAVAVIVLIVVLVGGGGDYGCREDVEADVASQVPGLVSEAEVDSMVDTCIELRKECEDSGQSNCDAGF